MARKCIGPTQLKQCMTSYAEQFANVERERSDMHPYQNDDVRFFVENPFSFGLIDLGLGKSVTGATVIADLDPLNGGPAGKWLIVGPIAVISTSWPDEFRTWRHLAHLRFTVLREDDKDPRLSAARKAARAAGTNESAAETAERNRIRAELAHSKTSIHLINFERLESLVTYWGRKWPYRFIIIDESSLMKSHKSKCFDCLKQLRISPGYIERMILLTATPASESYEAFFSQTFLLDKGERFGKHITHFRDRYFTFNRYSMKHTLRPGADVEILDKLAGIVTVRKREDYFDTERAMILIRKVQLRPSEMDLYLRMQDESIMTLPDGTEVEAATAAALSQKLSQMASGVVYETKLGMPEDYDPDIDDDAPDMISERIVHKIHDHKIESLRALIEEHPGQNMLVAYQHKSSLDRLAKALPKAQKWDKAGKSKAPWNAGNIPQLLMHPKSGAHGNNLQKGGHIIVFFDVPWSREQFTQLVGRLDRQGQTHPVTVFLMVANGTIDEVIAKAQQTKGDAEAKMFAMLKRMIAKKRKLDRSESM